MSYRVIWRERIRNSLFTLTFLTQSRGGDVGALSRAVEEINRRLETDPAEAGESRDGNERVLIVHPLSVFFEAFEEAQVVLIYTAVYYPRTRA
jgi:hypothetical protein